MPTLMDSHHLPLLLRHQTLPLDTPKHPLSRHLEVDGVDEDLAVPCGEDGGLVADVGDLGAAETWRQRGQSPRVLVFGFLWVEF
jgi:hypothetical protein